MEVKINTPTDQVLATATMETSITDARGRVIALRKPGVLAQYRLVEMIGESAKNEVYMGMILPLLFISTIDGESVLVTRKSEMEALIQRLDDDGINAVMEGVKEHFGALPDPEADKAVLKK